MGGIMGKLLIILSLVFIAGCSYNYPEYPKDLGGVWNGPYCEATEYKGKCYDYESEES